MRQEVYPEVSKMSRIQEVCRAGVVGAGSPKRNGRDVTEIGM